MQRIWFLEREVIRLRARREIRRRAYRSGFIALSAFLMLQALSLAIFWGSVGLIQNGRSLLEVILISSATLTVIALVLAWLGLRRLRETKPERRQYEQPRSRHRPAA